MKKCIFCGKPISEKSIEHVIPKWLIELTGDKGRIASFGMDYSKILNNTIESKDIQRRKYPFLRFTFPACKQCNESYGSDLEAKTKKIMEKILNEQAINVNEIVTLLNWFDKIRIGLWLGYLYYNEQLEEIKPKFYINERIELKDRALFIYKCEENVEGINFVGPGGPLFSMIPSCFLFRINNYFFLNISTDFLLLEDLGFPYPKTIFINENGNQYSNLIVGKNKVNQNILEKYKIKETSKAIFQPLFKQHDDICKMKDSYVCNNSIDQCNGRGCIYIKDNDIHKMENDEEYLLRPNETYIDAANLSNSLGLKVSKILMEFAKESYIKIKESKIQDDKKESMCNELHSAITVEELRMKRSKLEVTRIFSNLQRV